MLIPRRVFPSRKWLKGALAASQAETVRLRNSLAQTARYYDDLGREVISLRAQAKAQAATIASMDEALAISEEQAVTAHRRGDQWEILAGEGVRTIAKLKRDLADARNDLTLDWRPGSASRLIRTLWASRRYYQGKAEALAEACTYWEQKGGRAL